MKSSEEERYFSFKIEGTNIGFITTFWRFCFFGVSISTSVAGNLSLCQKSPHQKTQKKIKKVFQVYFFTNEPQSLKGPRKCKGINEQNEGYLRSFME